jgi:hypothetical protein
VGLRLCVDVDSPQGPYELCDAVRGSDHRPVSAAYYVKVNGNIYGPSSIGDLIPIKLTLKEMTVDFSHIMMPSFFEHDEKDDAPATGGGGAAEGEGKAKHKKAKSTGPKPPKSVNIDAVQLAFPLPAEDPLIHQRKAAELARALGPYRRAAWRCAHVLRGCGGLSSCWARYLHRERPESHP